MGLLQRGVDERKVSTDTLTAPEITYLLKTIHNCEFEGKDVLLLADVVNKLQNQLKAK
jgi:hypothetical protein|tara:strand:+ start:48 stop:221 length:174 start_codon:yes stop_codon:yes gene_type:complete